MIPLLHLTSHPADWEGMSLYVYVSAFGLPSDTLAAVALNLDSIEMWAKYWNPEFKNRESTMATQWKKQTNEQTNKQTSAQKQNKTKQKRPPTLQAVTSVSELKHPMMHAELSWTVSNNIFH